MIKRRGFFGALIAALVAMFSRKTDLSDHFAGSEAIKIPLVLRMFHHDYNGEASFESYTFKLGQLTVAQIASVLDFGFCYDHKEPEVWTVAIHALILDGTTEGTKSHWYNCATKEEAIQHVLKELGCDAV